jgi:hypothetical protein
MTKNPDRVLGDGAAGDIDNPEQAPHNVNEAAVLNVGDDVETVDTAADAAGGDSKDSGDSKDAGSDSKPKE